MIIWSEIFVWGPEIPEQDIYKLLNNQTKPEYSILYSAFTLDGKMYIHILSDEHEQSNFLQQLDAN